MRLAAVLAALALTAGCGGSSGTQDLSADGASPSTVASDAAASPETSPSPLPARSAKPPPTPTVTVSGGTATSGPGRLSSPPASPSPRPTPSPVAGTVTVTDDDSGTTVRLALGQRLRVRLSRDTWDPPVSSADGVAVRRSSSGGYPSDQPVDATFEAVGKGSADVTATSDAACFHTEPRCMMPQRQWSVHVTVRQT